MKLSDFIRSDINPILDAWEGFASAIPAAKRMKPALVRDHARGMLQAIAADLDQPQSPHQQSEKSQGRAPHGVRDTEAQMHGAARVTEGFSADECLSEFRALRASVMRLWSQSSPNAPPVIDEDMVRFNEAIDQALTESLARYSSDKERIARLFDTLLSSSSDLNFIVDVQGNVVYANKAMAALYGILPNTNPNIYVIDGPGPMAGIRQKLREVIASRVTVRAELAHKGSAGEELTWDCLLAPVITPDGSLDAIAGMVRATNGGGVVRAIAGTMRDITERKAHDANIVRVQNLDALTGLPNRSLFRDRLEQEIKRAERKKLSVALLYIDLDGFKDVNDQWGHDAGDQMLQQAAQRIRACVRSTDSVARMGGDEFTVILAELQELGRVEPVAQKILQELAKPFTVAGHELAISASIGIALFPLDTTAPGIMIGIADQAMYVAKRAGRNRFSFFTEEMRETAWLRLKMIEDLRHALVDDQFCIHYQPIVDLALGRIVKAEALVRWQHPRAGMMLPASFIDLAEEAGLIGDIDGWVLDEAVARAKEWSSLLGRAFQVSVNNSPAEFMGQEPMKNWNAHLERFAAAPHCIAVEVTEDVLLNASSLVVDKLKALHRAGVQLSLDHFGSGYSSMSCLKAFDVDYMKIDPVLVHDSMASPDRRSSTLR